MNMELGQVWTKYYNPRTNWWTWEVIRLKKVLPGFVSQWDCWCKNLGVGGVWGHKTRLLVSIKMILANWQTTQEGDAVFHSQYIKWSQNTEQALYPPEVIWGCVGVVQLSSRPTGSALGCLACCCGPFAPSTTAARAWTILLAISRTQWVLNCASSALGHQFCS